MCTNITFVLCLYVLIFVVVTARCHSITELGVSIDDLPSTNELPADDTLSRDHNRPNSLYAEIVNSRQLNYTWDNECATSRKHVQVDITDLEGIYDRADNIKRQSQISVTSVHVTEAAAAAADATVADTSTLLNNDSRERPYTESDDVITAADSASSAEGDCLISMDASFIEPCRSFSTISLASNASSSKQE